LAEDSDRFFRKRRDELLQAQAGREPGKKGAPGQAPPPPASMTLPDHLRYRADGVGEFLNPGEGAEMLFGFDFLRSALEKAGTSLTRDERSVLREFIQEDAISPAFVKRVSRDYSPAAIQAEFGPRAEAPEYWLEWLLRRWKGEHYRIRYPPFSVI
jgi:hypothetical protein